MKKPRKVKDFLELPKYPGGHKDFESFIYKNLKYPKAALEKGIEGVVFLHYDVDDNGKVSNIIIEKGVGYGCDEEAIRLVGLIKYPKIKNRGVRVKTSM